MYLFTKKGWNKVMNYPIYVKLQRLETFHSGLTSSSNLTESLNNANP